MAEQNFPDRQPPGSKPFLEWIIPTIGIILIFFSVILACLYSQDLPVLAFAIALFSVGCVTLWFGFINPAVRSGEERIEKINKSADEILLRLSKRKK